ALIFLRDDATGDVELVALRKFSRAALKAGFLLTANASGVPSAGGTVTERGHLYTVVPDGRAAAAQHIAFIRAILWRSRLRGEFPVTASRQALSRSPDMNLCRFLHIFLPIAAWCLSLFGPALNAQEDRDQSSRGSEGKPDAITAADLEKIVYWSGEGGALYSPVRDPHPVILRLRAHREEVLPVLKQWVHEPPKGASTDGMRLLVLIGRIGTEEDLPFLVATLESSRTRNSGLASDAIRALAFLNTKHSARVICDLIDGGGDKNLTLGSIVSSCRYSTQLALIDKVRALVLNSQIKPSDRAEALESAAFMLDAAGREQDRDELITACLGDATDRVVGKAAYSVSEYAAFSCRAKVQEVLAKKGVHSDTTIDALQAADDYLVAVSSPDRNGALLAYYFKRPTALGNIMRHLVPEAGLAERIRATLVEARKRARAGTMRSHNDRALVYLIKKHGGTVTEEDEHWPHVKDPTTGQWVLPKKEPSSEGK
ncbi:MAG: hypothetical protein HY719_12300, partial [Planctomycetes bacterium]|nr:hypothetical protein [Planctomycetota bacterium]